MLSIRTQDRMALVPYDSKINIECNHYKVANKDEIEKVKRENEELKQKLIYEARNEKSNLGKNISMLTLDKRFDNQKQKEPKEVYSEWSIKSNGESGYGILGTYPTKERALEVLDEIETTISINGYSTINDNGLMKPVYQMPKE